MEKLRIIKHAKEYIDLLLTGVDPISGESIETDCIMKRDRIKKCFAFISDILGEVIDNNGYVTLEGEVFDNTDVPQYELVRKKVPFFVNSDLRSRIRITDEPISPTAFVKNVNAAVDAEIMEKLSLTTINKWLLKMGYVEDRKVPTVINKNEKHITPISGEVGIIEKDVINIKTGEVKAQVMFTEQAQRFILDNIDEILR